MIVHANIRNILILICKALLQSQKKIIFIYNKKVITLYNKQLTPVKRKLKIALPHPP